MANPSGTPDRYNPARDYTQAIPQGPTNGWRPRMIGDPGDVVKAGPTASQLAFRKANVSDPVSPAVATPAAQPQPQGGYIYTPVSASFDASGGRSSQQQPYGQQVKNSAGQWVRIAPGNYSPVTFPGQAPTPINWAQIGDEYGKPGLWATRDRNPNYMLPTATPTPKPGAPVPHRPYMEKGGVIPEVTNYARGGAVEPAGDHNPNYTTSRSYGGGPTPRYNPVEDTAYWTPAKHKGNKASAKSGKKAGPPSSGRERTANVPTPTPAPRSASGPTHPSWDGQTGATDVAGAQGVLPVPSGAATVPQVASTPQAVRPTAPNAVRPAPTERAQPVQPERVQPSQAHDFTVTRQPPHLLPIVGGDGTIVGYTPSDQSAVRPEGPVSPNLPEGGIPGPPGWQQLDQNSQGGYPGVEGMLFGPPHYARVVFLFNDWENNANYTTSQSYSAPTGEGDAPAADNVKPTPMLMDHVSQALDGGVKFLTQHFGLNSSGGMPAPGDQQQAQAGAQAFAQGQGAATPEEIKGIDDHVDPERKLSEGDRQLTRLAKMTQWYLQQNRPKDAQAAAASLMQYGAQRFSRLGAMAGAAYEEYQTTHDPAALKHTTDFLRAAYQMVPDGSALDVKIDPKTHELVATHTGPDGEEVNFSVEPGQLPGMIRGVMDKSSYWQQVFRMADPAGYRQQAGWAHQAAAETDKRAYTEKTKLAGETRAEARARAREDRTAARAAASRDERSKRYDMNMETVGPARQAAETAYAATQTDGFDPESEAGKAAQTALDQAASRLYDALPPGRNRDKYMKDAGFEPDAWSYVTATAAAPAGGSSAAASLYKGDTPPEAYPNAKRAKDGTWWVVPTDGGKPMAVGAGAP